MLDLMTFRSSLPSYDWIRRTYRSLAICWRRSPLADSLPARSHQIRVELFCRSVRVLQLANGDQDVTLGEHTVSAGALELGDLLRGEVGLDQPDG